MAFTSDRLFIVRVDDGKAKASYPLKSVQLAPSDKVNPVSTRQDRVRFAGMCGRISCSLPAPPAFCLEAAVCINQHVLRRIRMLCLHYLQASQMYDSQSLFRL